MILSIECSTQLGSVALVHQGQVLGWQASFKPKAHSELLNQMVEEVCRQGQIQLKDLEAIATTVGPGNFTGLRVGLNAAKVYAYLLQIPLSVSTTLELLELQSRHVAGLRWFALNAYNNMIFLSCGPSGQTATKPVALTLSEAKSKILEQPGATLIGEGFVAYPKWTAELLSSHCRRMPSATDYPQALVLGLAVEKKLVPTQDWKSVQPLYIKASEAEEVKKKLVTN